MSSYAIVFFFCFFFFYFTGRYVDCKFKATYRNPQKLFYSVIRPLRWSTMSACASACTTSLNWTTPIYSQETELHTPKVWWWFWQTWLWRRLSHSLTHLHNASNRVLYFNCLIAEYWSLITTEPFHWVSISAIIHFNRHSFLNVNIADELKKMLLTRACQKFSRSPWQSCCSVQIRVWWRGALFSALLKDILL